jgi:formylglycine-generating enzyme required for sulfatase activity
VTNTYSLVVLFLVIVGLSGLAAGDSHEVGEKFADALRSGGSGPQVIVIPDGLFVLGGGAPGQQDLGRVQIAYLIAVGVTEVTIGQYREFLKLTRSAGLKQMPEGNDDLPVSGVSWDEAEAYVTWLSRESGQHYRLPSASEWEYAARAGTSTLYSWGDESGDGQANCLNCGGESSGGLMPVASFKANAWGLYDMHGNVWEWTKDCMDPNAAPPPNGMPKLFGNCDSRELRSGSAQSDAWSIRAGARASALRSQKMQDVGFRVVRVVLD